jgi:hypothetical protein
MAKLPPARFLFYVQPVKILAHSDIVAKNNEIAPGEIFVSDQPVKF